MTVPYRTALITGVTGQDGAWLASQLLADGVRVVGTHRAEGGDRWRLRALGFDAHPALTLRALDPSDGDGCLALVRAVEPDAVFHLAGQTRVADSFAQPAESIRANGLSTVNLLEAVRANAPTAHLVVATSAEIFGESTSGAQSESAPLGARTPYGVSKLLAHAAVGAWRASFRLRASSAILFNHESELRDPSFVTRKITRGVARIALGSEALLMLGNLDAERDFGYAPDYARAMATMAARANGDDFVLATGAYASVREFADAAFAAIGIALDWRGRGVDAVAVERGGERVLVRVDAGLYRPVDAARRVGDSTKARRELGFGSTLTVADIARRMVEADLALERAR